MITVAAMELAEFPSTDKQISKIMWPKRQADFCEFKSRQTHKKTVSKQNNNKKPKQKERKEENAAHMHNGV